MVIERITRFAQQTADNLNPADSILPIIKVHSETIVVCEGPSKISDQTIGASWIVGSSTNGLVGANTGTQSGGQQVVGSSGRSAVVVLSVSNPNLVFKDFLDFDTYIDTSESSATVDTTNQKIDF